MFIKNVYIIFLTVRYKIFTSSLLFLGTTKGKPKKELKAANRFGFRPMAPMSNKVADLQEETKCEKEEPKSPTTNVLKVNILLILRFCVYINICVTSFC